MMNCGEKILVVVVFFVLSSWISKPESGYTHSAIGECFLPANTVLCESKSRHNAILQHFDSTFIQTVHLQFAL